VCDRYAKYAFWPNQLDRTGYESGAGCEITSDAYAIGLISRVASKDSTVFSLICDRWLTVNYRRLRVQPIPGVLDSADMTFGCGCEAGPIANVRGGGWGLALALLGWTCSEPLRRGLAGRRCSAGRAHVTLRSTSVLLRPATQSSPQVVQSVPFSSSPHASATRNL